MSIATESASPIVFVVDDDRDVLNSLTFALEIEGFTVFGFDSAEALLGRAALPEHACLLLDQQMPNMDGLTLLACLRARGDHQPAVLITTSDAAVRKLAMSVGVAIVEKPLVCSSLVSKVHELLGASRKTGIGRRIQSARRSRA